MTLRGLLKSGIVLDLYFFKNNRAAFLSTLLWPYMILGLLLGMGYVVGNPQSFKRNLGVDVNPVVYFVSSTLVAMSSLSVMWEVGGQVLHLRWIGVLPYVILSPHRLSMTLVFSYVPRYLIYSSLGLLEFLPLILLTEGVGYGLAKAALILVALVVGMLPLLGFSALFASVLLSIREETNILAWLNPVILLFSGAFYPAYLLPHWARLVSSILPPTYTIELARLAALVGEPRLAPMTFLIGVLLGLSFAYNLLAYGLMGAGERRAMGSGVL